MSDATLTNEERRNLERVQVWVEAWNDSERLTHFVKDFYSLDCEVFLPLQKTWWVKRGKSAHNFQDVETEGAKNFRRRTMRIQHALARGATVAVEAMITWETFSGKTFDSWFAAFLTFDADGKIETDHTFQPVIDPSKARLPAGLQAALDRIAQEQ